MKSALIKTLLIKGMHLTFFDLYLYETFKMNSICLQILHALKSYFSFFSFSVMQETSSNINIRRYPVPGGQRVFNLTSVNMPKHKYSKFRVSWKISALCI